MNQQVMKLTFPKLIKENCVIDKRGLPIPYVVLIDNMGNPHFKINDTYKTMDCIYNDKCSICGTKLKEDKWLIGGPQSAFHEKGCYIDTPVHYECGEFALKTCPYLAYSNYNGKLDMDKLKKQISGKVLLNDPTLDSNRVPLFVFGKISGFSMTGNEYLVRNKPFLEIEYWNNGIKLDENFALETISKHFKEKNLNYDII